MRECARQGGCGSNEDQVARRVKRRTPAGPRVKRGQGLLLVALLAAAIRAIVSIPSGAASSDATGANSGNAIDPPSGNTDEWPEVVATSTENAYVDHEMGEANRLESPKVSVEAGTVDGVSWSLATYLAAPDSIGEGLVEPAPCAQVFLGDQGEYGGGGVCLTPLSLSSVRWRW
jgi:hypothetical protein